MSAPCAKCGAHNVDDAAFCNRCGSPLEAPKQGIRGRILWLGERDRNKAVAKWATLVAVAAVMIIVLVAIQLLIQPVRAATETRSSNATATAQAVVAQGAATATAQAVTRSNMTATASAPTPTPVPPTATPAPAATPAPVPQPGGGTVPASDPRSTVTRYYTALAAQDFQTAWGLLSSRQQSTQSFSAWANGHSQTRSATVSGARVVDQSASTATVSFTLVSVDDQNGRYVTKTFQGTWQLVLVNGRWLLDAPSIRQVA